MEVKELYRKRFDRNELARKDKLWQVLCRHFFQRFVPEDAVVVDLGAGYCEFVNNIKAGLKYAVDLNEDTKDFARPGVEVFRSSAAELGFIPDGSVDVVFMSNFLEHLPDKEAVWEVLLEARRICRIGGRVLLLQPNIRYSWRKYWDFFDHRIPLSDKSVAEALEAAGFAVVKELSRFLPLTTKSRLPQAGFLVRLYLKMPLLWKVFGGQMFIVARKRD
ncbi:MAG: class I SAM-dependent methyltransferase [Peptococcaceae bacterium]|nr:MAG: class I SAM-dependent methyltransferase [Peptococcaceae bacterium]